MEYYLITGESERAVAMAEKFASYTASDQVTWQSIFDLFAAYENGDPVCQAGVVRLAGMLNDWNRENMGRIQVSEEAAAFIASMGGSLE